MMTSLKLLPTTVNCIVVFHPVCGFRGICSSYSSVMYTVAKVRRTPYQLSPEPHQLANLACPFVDSISASILPPQSISFDRYGYLTLYPKANYSNPMHAQGYYTFCCGGVLEKLSLVWTGVTGSVAVCVTLIPASPDIS